MAVVLTSTATGAAAIAASLTAKGRGFHVEKVTIKFSSAPTTSENITFTLNSAAGAAYDTVLLTYDPSADSATSVVWNGVGSSTQGTDLYEGDSLDVAYTNTDTRTYGLTFYYTEGPGGK